MLFSEILSQSNAFAFKCFFTLQKQGNIYNHTMNRRNADRLGSDSHDLSSKQRIVRRKVHRSLSPPLPRSAREVRTSSSNELYHSQQQRPTKYIEYRHSSGDLRDERLGGPKERGSYAPRHRENMDSHEDLRGPAPSRGIGNSIKRSTSDMGHHSMGPFHSEKFDKFEYSLHVCNINSQLSDIEVKNNLFREFKKYGYVHIKVLGYSKDRHAFVNYTRLDDARAALNDMDNSNFYGQNLEVTWSHSTINRYPQVGVGGGGGGGGNSHPEHRSSMGGGVPKSRSFQQHESPSMDYFNQGGGGGGHNSGGGDHHFHNSPRNSRDINYRHRSPSPVPPPPPSRSQQQNHSLHVAKDVHIKTPGTPILDPNATRTLFVGNLESDVTERELRDLFSPYGRIESVDIKVQRSVSTAYAFVKFFTITDAMAAKGYMHGRKYGNIKLKIGFGKGSPSAKVWVGNLSGYADLTEVRTELDRFGLIRRVDYNSGDNHAFVHFDSLDAAQTAVSSLTNFRFRSTNRPLKIDLSQPVHRPDSDFEDDFEFHDAPPPSMGSGGGGGRQVHSRNLSPPEIGSNPAMLSRRGGGGRINRADSYSSRPMSRDDSPIDHRIGVAAIRTSYRPNRGRRVVTEVQEPSHTSARHAHNAGGGVNYADERNGFRKRGRSPSMNENLDIGEHPRQFGHSVRGRGNSDGHRMGSGGGGGGGTPHNGDFDFKHKRPRNGFDAYQYHKLHATRGGTGGRGASHRIGSASSSHSGSDRDREFRDREFKGHNEDRFSRDRRDERREREGERNERDSSIKSDHKTESERMEHGADSANADAKNSAIEKISPPPPPPPPIIEMMQSYETSDPALKLNDAVTGSASPLGENKPGSVKANGFKVETLGDMARVYPVVWHGNLVLKNTGFPTRMHLIGGDPAVAELLVRCKDPKDDTDALRITQRLRLEPPRLEEVNKRMTSAGPSGHCILLALPGAIPAQQADENENAAVQLRPLKSLVSYLEQKEAAGIVALNATDVSGGQRESIIGVLHAFPPCEFSQNQLLKIAPDLGDEPAKDDHVVVLLVKGTV